ncbi:MULTISPECIES: diguanylate cyclase [Pseudomonas]|uniref:diguanylate cyclase n=1 Tax=Pseudomonas quercus TaxID=2722792 RepID=A0ABX0YM32_9PSED|nr:MULTISPECIES: diguanylate cyclase [Pseudomonas]MBF7144802.1 diguanylate cyclase [Pseudomonas sp. LY10J]NJP03339.1 diguanylate cyclase [Pseudomonas quercus]
MPAKPGSFAKRMYLPRFIGSGIGFWAVGAALQPAVAAPWVWAVLVFHGFIWPHVAFLLARRVAVPYLVERRNMIMEAAFGGLWVAAMQFNPLPTILLVSMLSMNCMAVGGPKLLRPCLVTLGVSLGVFIAVLRPGFSPEATALQVYACLPMLAVYPLAVGNAAYRLAEQLARHKRAFKDFSRKDSLTQLLNQGAWRGALDDAFSHLRGSDANATLALLDIDHFKRINDQHGHLIGDEVIKVFGAIIHHYTGPLDKAGRIGGDEFAVVFSGIDAQEATRRLARMQVALEAELVARPDLPQVSMSIGTATFKPSFLTPEDWIRASDNALYAAKHKGRNQIVAAAEACV